MDYSTNAEWEGNGSWACAKCLYSIYIFCFFHWKWSPRFSKMFLFLHENRIGIKNGWWHTRCAAPRDQLLSARCAAGRRSIFLKITSALYEMVRNWDIKFHFFFNFEVSHFPAYVLRFSWFRGQWRVLCQVWEAAASLLLMRLKTRQQSSKRRYISDWLGLVGSQHHKNIQKLHKFTQFQKVRFNIV